jgi:hypothetical protein
MTLVMEFGSEKQKARLPFRRNCGIGSREGGGRWRRNLWEISFGGISAEDVFGKVNHSKDPTAMDL